MTNIKHIIIFDQYPFLGGGQVLLLSIIEASSRIADRVSVVIPFGGSLEDVVKSLKKSNITLYNVPYCKVNNREKGLHDLFKIMIYNSQLLIRYAKMILGADIIYANGPRYFPALFLMSWLFRKKCIFHIHLDHRTIEKKFIRFVTYLNIPSRIIFNSNYLLRCFATATPGIENNTRVIVIENGLSYRFRNLQFVDRFSLQADKLKIAVIGELCPEKGQDRAIDLALENLDIEIHIIGRVGNGADLWVANLKNKAPKNVYFHNEVSDIPALIDKIGIQIVLVPSRIKESFGLVAIEDMACSCISIVFDSGALVDIANKTGALLCRNENDLLNIIKQLKTMSPNERVSLARNQYEKTMHIYNSERFIREILNVIEEV